jgi:serine/threonine protein kinase
MTSDPPWACSNIAVALRIATRLKPRFQDTNSSSSMLLSRHIPPKPQNQQQHMSDACPSCAHCASLQALVPLPMERISVVCEQPAGSKTYARRPLAAVIESLVAEEQRFLLDLEPHQPSPFEIGRGGDGRVYLGYLMKRPVAIKVIHVPATAPPAKVQRRMKALHGEAMLGLSVRRLQDEHPVLCDFGGAHLVSRLEGVAVQCKRSPGKPKQQLGTEHIVVLVQRFYELGSLDQLVHRRRRAQMVSRSAVQPLQKPLLSEQEIYAVLSSLCISLRVLHQQLHVVHRDVKPQNIFLSRDTSLSRSAGCVSVILGDMGLSRDANAVRTMCGTPKFMAPELVSPLQYSIPSSAGPSSATRALHHTLNAQRATAPYGPAVDIFALGVTIQYAISGGALEVVRRRWETPLQSPESKSLSSPPLSRQCLRRNIDGDHSAAFKIPVHWYCTRGGSSVGCPCGRLHAPLVQLINRMVHPDPHQRPTASGILEEISLLPSCVAVTNRKLRECVWNQINEDNEHILSMTADGMGNVRVTSCPSLLLDEEEISALQPPPSALHAEDVAECCRTLSSLCSSASCFQEASLSATSSEEQSPCNQQGSATLSSSCVPIAQEQVCEMKVPRRIASEPQSLQEFLEYFSPPS